MDTWVASTFWLLWVMLLQTKVYKYLFEILLSNPLDTDPEAGFAGSNSTFWRTIVVFSMEAAWFYIPANSEQWFQFLYILTNTWYFLFWFISNHPNGYEVIFHCGFDLPFPND